MNPLLSLSPGSDVPVPSFLEERGGGKYSFLIGSPGYYFPWPILFILLQLDSFLLLLLLFYLNGIYLSVIVLTFDFTINKHNLLPRPGFRF